MKNLLDLMVRELVDYPDQVRVNEIDGGHTSVMELSAAKPDIGKIIGKKGRNIGAIRTIINAASAKVQKHKHVIVEVIE